MTQPAGQLALLKYMAPLQVPTGASPLDLELHVRELPDGRLETTLVYATDLFDPSTAQRMSNHFMVCYCAVLHEASPLCLHLTRTSLAHLMGQSQAMF